MPSEDRSGTAPALPAARKGSGARLEAGRAGHPRPYTRGAGPRRLPAPLRPGAAPPALPTPAAGTAPQPPPSPTSRPSPPQTWGRPARLCPRRGAASAGKGRRARRCNGLLPPSPPPCPPGACRRLAAPTGAVPAPPPPPSLTQPGPSARSRGRRGQPGGRPMPAGRLARRRLFLTDPSGSGGRGRGCLSRAGPPLRARAGPARVSPLPHLLHARKLNACRGATRPLQPLSSLPAALASQAPRPGEVSKRLGRCPGGAASVWEPREVLCPRTRHRRCPRARCRAFERGGNRQGAAGRWLRASAASLCHCPPRAHRAAAWSVLSAWVSLFFHPFYFRLFVFNIYIFPTLYFFFSHIQNLKKTTAPNLHC